MHSIWCDACEKPYAAESLIPPPECPYCSELGEKVINFMSAELVEEFFSSYVLMKNAEKRLAEILIQVADKMAKNPKQNDGTK